MTIVFSTHAPQHGLDVASDVLLMKGGRQLPARTHRRGPDISESDRALRRSRRPRRVCRRQRLHLRAAVSSRHREQAHRLPHLGQRLARSAASTTSGAISTTCSICAISIATISAATPRSSSRTRWTARPCASTPGRSTTMCARAASSSSSAAGIRRNGSTWSTSNGARSMHATGCGGPGPRPGSKSISPSPGIRSATRFRSATWAGTGRGSLR